MPLVDTKSYINSITPLNKLERQNKDKNKDDISSCIGKESNREPKREKPQKIRKLVMEENIQVKSFQKEVTKFFLIFFIYIYGTTYFFLCNVLPTNNFCLKFVK